MSPPLVCFLFDNGSLRAEATLELRKVAAALATRLGAPVVPVSLLHSSGVDPSLLGGEAAALLEPALRARLAAGRNKAVLLPFFFGPSAALTRYLPERLEALKRSFPSACFSLAAPLVDLSQPDDTRVTEALAKQVRRAMERDHLDMRTQVVLVDHGSPQPEVTAVRDYLARMLAKALEGEVAGVYPASMERREGAAYAFNDPLLADRLRLPPCNRGKVLVCLQFLAPGRHAGRGGDIEQIGLAAQAENPALELRYTQPLGEDDRLLSVLAERYAQAVQALNEVDGK